MKPIKESMYYKIQKELKKEGKGLGTTLTLDVFRKLWNSIKSDKEPMVVIYEKDTDI